MHTLILAAGAGSRFGGAIKQLALVGGQTLLQSCLSVARIVTPDRVGVVLGCEWQKLAPGITGASLIINPNWRTGIASSIACGVSALPTTATAVLILLCDQAAITATDLTRLLQSYREQADAQSAAAPIVCAAYAGDVGVPAIFPRACFAELMALEGDSGAKKLLFGSTLVRVAMECAAMDIDTQDDLRQFSLAQR